MISLDTVWLHSLNESVPAYLAKLRFGDQPGRYLPCLRGTTPIGREVSLGFSCFALKLHHMLGRWELVPEQDRDRWVEFIQLFQEPGGDGAFIDDAEVQYLKRHAPWRERLRRVFGGGGTTSFARSIVLAETKQAIATLAEVNEAPVRPFRGFPTTPESVHRWLESLDWSRPWGAGGQAAGLVVFLQTQAPAFLAPPDVAALLQICRDFYGALAHQPTGAYFRGNAPPEHGELINGAMKVLMALHWLDVPPHHPERLIATCLQKAPSPGGCHLVDAIYVLHQCVRGEADVAVRRYCGDVADLIRAHAHEDGGFSFHVKKAQTNYYGVPISRGLDESDIQGTCLLIWALAMMWKMLQPENAMWKTLKP